MNLGEQCGESLTRLHDSGKLDHWIGGQLKGLIQDDLSKKTFQNFFPPTIITDLKVYIKKKIWMQSQSQILMKQSVSNCILA